MVPDDSTQFISNMSDSAKNTLVITDSNNFHGAGTINFSCVTSAFNRCTASSLLIKRVINLETIQNKIANKIIVNAIACIGIYIPKLFTCNTLLVTIKTTGRLQAQAQSLL